MADRDELMRHLEAEATDCYGWSNGPGYHYAVHSHTFEKILFCVGGAITFRIEPQGEEIHLHPGDRMALPPGTPHSALVGPEGVSCLEGRRRPAPGLLIHGRA